MNPPYLKITKTRTRPKICMLALAGCFVVFSSILLAGAEKGFIQVQQVQVRQSHVFYAPEMGVLKYGDEITKVGEKAGWVEITTADGLKGWIHESALSEKKLVLQSDKKFRAQDATDEEIALAGKGFSREVEQEYRKKNPDLDFNRVDKMEALKLSSSEMQAFIKEGKLDEAR